MANHADDITITAGPTPASVNMVQSGTGAPSHSAAKGTLYLRLDGSSTSTRAYINTNGTTGWAAVTTAS